jgi:peptide/nickel transport system substrate-binding protein
MTTSSFNRRSVLRGAAVGALGLGGAALLGCGGGGDGGDTGGAASRGDAGADSGAPKNVKRAPGYDPTLGKVDINNRKVIPGGTYRVSATDTTREQDVDVSISGADVELYNDRLVYANGWTMEISPDMLASYERVDKQGLEMVFKLRPGIKTHNKAPLNGRVFTAKDVAYSLRRKAGLVDPTAASKYARREQYFGLEKAEAVDDVTVKLTFSRPNGSVMNALADPRAQMIPVEMDQLTFKDWSKQVGTGAWMQTEYLDGSRQVFKAFPDYYRSWDEGGRPGWDTYEKIVIADRASSLAAYISGQIHILGSIRPEEEPQLAASAKDSMFNLWPGPTWDHFAFNMTLPSGIWKDERVRKAIQLVIDYKAMNDPLGAGWTYGAVTHAQFPESITSADVAKLPGYNPATKQKDIADAQKMMEAAGHPQGQGLKWDNVNNGQQVSDNNVRYVDMLKKSFPRVEVKLKSIADYASATNVLNNKEFEGRIWNHTSVPDAAADAITYHHTKGGRNYQGFSQPWADEILDKLTAAQTLQERKDLLQQFTKRYLEWGPCLVFIRHPAENSAIHGNVGGYDLIAGTWMYPSYQSARRWLWQTEA